MKKRNWIIIAAVIVLIGGALLAATLIPRHGKNVKLGMPEGVTIDLSCLFLGRANAEEADPVAALGLEDAGSYLVIWRGDYFYPVALTEANAGRELRVGLDDQFNVVTLGVNSFRMTEASCPDQICVSEGEVTLENRDERILGSCVYCLPNQITLEMMTRDELSALIAQASGVQ